MALPSLDAAAISLCRARPDGSPSNEASRFRLEGEAGVRQTCFQAPTKSIINSDG